MIAGITWPIGLFWLSIRNCVGYFTQECHLKQKQNENVNTKFCQNKILQ